MFFLVILTDWMTDSQKTVVAFITGDVELPMIAVMLMMMTTDEDEEDQCWRELDGTHGC